MTLVSCPAPDCDQDIEDRFVACLKHWRDLPAGLRSKISRVRRTAPVNLPAQMVKAQRVWGGLPPPVPRARRIVHPEEVPRVPARYLIREG